MQMGGFRMDKGVELYNLAKALQILDDNLFDHEKILGDIVRFKRLVFRYPDQYRTAKSDYMHHVGKDKLKGKEYSKCYDAIEEISEYYGRRSWTFNTIVRSISQVKKTKEQVTREVLNKNSKPPAFDKYMRATRTKQRDSMRKELEEWVTKCNDSFLWDMKSKFQKVIKDLEESSKEIVRLTNGTTTAIEWNGVNINDILSIAFAPKCIMDSKISKLGTYLKVANRYSEDDDFVYIELSSSNLYEECGGEHIEIPDKDAKIREIYRMYPWVQVISKKLHKLLDRVARTLEGNYTYKHRNWIKNLVKENWNNTKYIIGADMTKYSDTLDRSFIVHILRAMGFKNKMCELIDYMYGMSIYDPTKVEILEGSDATFQGQYGDFPMITIANLVIQRFIYYKVGQRCLEGYNAAVGDDTGMVFDRYDPSIMDTMVEAYGCVGVNINRDKTGELIMGKGSIDFVKLEVDCMGIMEFLNLRSFNEQNTDSLVRDVLELMTVSDEKRWSIAEALFGVGTGKRLADLSIINGGINDRPITERDLALYLSRSEKIKQLQTYTIDDTELALNKMQQYLWEEMDEHYHYYLCDTPLRVYLADAAVDNIPEELEKQDELIKMAILNMQRLGLSRGTIKNFRSWLGVIPSEARKEFDKMVLGKHHDAFLASVWSEISAYETFAAKRKSSESKKHKRVSYMLPVIRGIYDKVETISIPDYEFYEETIMHSVEEYRKAENTYKAVRNTKLALKRLEGVAWLSSEVYFGNLFKYLYIKTDKEVLKRRLYGVSYQSKYSLLSVQEYNTYLAPHLEGLDLDYESFNMNFRESAYQDLWLPDTLTKMGFGS